MVADERERPKMAKSTDVVYGCPKYLRRDKGCKSADVRTLGQIKI